MQLLVAQGSSGLTKSLKNIAPSIRRAPPMHLSRNSDSAKSTTKMDPVCKSAPRKTVLGSVDPAKSMANVQLSTGRSAQMKRSSRNSKPSKLMGKVKASRVQQPTASKSQSKF